jgi:hypothetical protein
MASQKYASTAPLALGKAAHSERERWVVPDGWQQGRGAWGGLVVAAIVRAAAAAEADAGFPARPVRSVSAEIVAPVVDGVASITCSEVRRGSATATWTVGIISGDQVAVTASVVFGDDRKGERLDCPPEAAPEAPPWRDVPVVEIGPPVAPPFLQHLRIRPITGMPYSGSSDDISMWLSYPDGAWDEAALLALVDGPWPVALVRISEPRPMATLSFLATVMIDPGELDPSEPLLFRSHLIAEHSGYLTERRALWTADGRLAVENLQLITLIR